MPSGLKKFTLVLLTCLLLVSVIGGLYGLFGSERGSRFLAEQARQRTGGALGWERMEGRLLGGLRLYGLRFENQQLALTAKSVALEWRPAALLGGRLQVHELAADGVVISLPESEQVGPGGPPVLPDFSSPVAVELTELVVSDLQLVRAGEALPAIERIELSAAMVGDRLQLDRLLLLAAGGSLATSGTLVTNSILPLDLAVDWSWQLPGGRPLGGHLGLAGDMRELALEHSGSGTYPVTLQGRASALLASPELELEVGLDGTPARVMLAGTVQLPPGGTPGFEGQLNWTGLRWPLAAVEPELGSPAGQLDLAGTMDAYTFRLSAELAGAQVPPGRWTGQGSGDLARLQLDNLVGEVFGGRLEFAGALDWESVPGWDLQVRGSGLDPGTMWPQAAGELQLELDSTGQLSSERGLVAELPLLRLRGEVARRPLSLVASARLEGEQLSLAGLRLESGANRLEAMGRLSPGQLALDWSLQVGAPGALVDGLAGEVSGSGHLGGDPDHPVADALLQARGLRLDDLTLDRLDAELRGGLQPGDALRLDLQLAQVRSADRVLLDSGLLQVSGSNAQHLIDLQFQAPGRRLTAQLEGGLGTTAADWRGRIDRLVAETGELGAWQLVAPVDLALAPEDFALGDTCLAAMSGTGRLCVAGNWGAESGGGLRATVEALPLRTLLADISGDISGDLQAAVDPGGAVQANLAMALSPGQVTVRREAQDVVQLAHGGGQLVLAVQPGNLKGELQFAAPGDGRLDAALNLPGFDPLSPQPGQALDGRVRAELPDLGDLATVFELPLAVAGRLDADLTLLGSLDNPRVAGELLLAEGRVDVPEAGLRLRELELQVASVADRDDLLTLRGGLVSGPGRMDIQGRVDIPAQSLSVTLDGDRLQVFDTADLRALASPSLRLDWRDQTLSVRGEVLVPEADITPQLALSPGLATEEEGTQGPGQPIAPSPDVVVTGREEVAEGVGQLQAPFRLDAQLALALGDRVRIDALGLVSRIEGAVRFSHSPDDPDLLPTARGQLSLDGGTFRSFGQDLEIETGQVIFPGGPVTEPELALRAVRWIDNDPLVSAAGVAVSGTVTEPTLELFSRPQLDPSEIQSYLLTGRSASSPDSVLSIGVYLYPSVYVGYGYNILEKTSEFNSLFTLTPRYGLGWDLGEADNNVNLTFTHER